MHLHLCTLLCVQSAWGSLSRSRSTLKPVFDLFHAERDLFYTNVMSTLIRF